jgi:hypothetical protein
MVDSGGKPSSGKSGPRRTNLIKEGKKMYYGNRITGFRKWDKKPDVYKGKGLQNVNIKSGYPHSQGVPKRKGL